MSRQAVILDAAQADFREIRRHVRTQFGDRAWAEVKQEFKDTIGRIALNPLLGTRIAELGDLGFDQYRQILVRQTRLVYAFDSQYLIVHLFIHTRRDFKAHLEQRLLAP